MPTDYDDHAEQDSPTPLLARRATAPEPSPLTEAHFTQITNAFAARRPLQGVVRTAKRSATVTLFIAAASVPLAFILPGWLSVLAVVALFIIGFVEYQGAERLRRGDPTATRLLAANQLAFLTLICLYCGFQAWNVSRSSMSLLTDPNGLGGQLGDISEVAPGLDQTMKQLAPLVMYGFYGLIAVLSIIFQGGFALYYYSRRHYVATLQAETPGWIRRLFRELGV